MSNSTRPGDAYPWAAYTQDHWAREAGMSVSTVQRWLDMLEGAGLIERERGQHSGKRVLSYLRPTRLALMLSKCRPGDLNRVPPHVSIDHVEPPPPDDANANLPELWVTLVETVTGNYVAPLLAKDNAQLQQFVGQCPPGQAANVLAFAVENWDQFTDHVKHVAGWPTLPDEPQIGFLLTHAGPAVNYMNDHQNDG